MEILVGFLESLEHFSVSKSEFPLIVLALNEGKILSDKLMELCSLLLCLGTRDFDRPFVYFLFNVEFVV